MITEPRLRQSSSRPGIALPAALGLLLLLDFVVIGALFAARRQRHGADLRLLDAALTASADAALFANVANWPSSRRAAMRIGGIDSTSATTEAPTIAVVATRVIRLTESLYFVVADARSRVDSTAHRRTSLVLRVPSTPLDAYALASAGDVRLSADVHVSSELAHDTSTGCVPRDSVPALALALRQGARVRLDSATAASPPVPSALVGDSAFQLSLGGEEWSSLAARAGLRLEGGAAHDANLPPLAYAAGDLTLRGGSGSGVLLVEGRLTIAGPLSYSGLVMTRGGVRTIADSGAFRGLIVSFAVGSNPDSTVDLRHKLELHASRCVVRQALAAVMRPRTASRRAWVELF